MTGLEDRVLVVTGEATASAVPDQCVVHLDLNAMADSAAGALDRVSAVTTSVIDGLKQRGTRDGDVRTVNISVNQFFDRDEMRVTAHAAKYQMTVLSRSVGEIGSLLGFLADLAGDHLQIQRFEMSHSDRKGLARTARRAAVVDATERATELADSAGVRLGPIIEISEGSDDRRFKMGGPSIAFAASSAAPIEPGEVSASIRVQVTYRIED